MNAAILERLNASVNRMRLQSQNEWLLFRKSYDGALRMVTNPRESGYEEEFDQYPAFRE